jgi:hypothetical protein
MRRPRKGRRPASHGDPVQGRRLPKLKQPVKGCRYCDRRPVTGRRSQKRGLRGPYAAVRRPLWLLGVNSPYGSTGPTWFFNVGLLLRHSVGLFVKNFTATKFDRI